MKRIPRILAVSVLMVCPLQKANAIIRDTTNINGHPLKYMNELGYYQKANRDAGDPRFMFSDANKKIDFGIGGTVAAVAYETFAGQIYNRDFKPSIIAVPTDMSTHFGMKVGDTELHAKVRSQLWNQQIIAYIKVGCDGNDKIELSQAYVSIAGFSIGKIPSFFMDMEVGIMTTGLASNSQIDKTNLLAGYTYRYKNWDFAISFERPTLNLTQYEAYKYGEILDYVRIGTRSQSVPDIPIHVKYRWDSGHVQLGFLSRQLFYWSYDKEDIYKQNGVSCHNFGWGAALSGNYKPTSKWKISWEFVGGKGISSYMPNVSDMCLDSGLITTTMPDGTYRLETIPVFSTLLAVQYNWSERFSSSLLVDYMKRIGQEGVISIESDGTVNNFNGSAYGLVNFFWYISKYAYMGGEYMFGLRSDFHDPGADPSVYQGMAHRVAFKVAYMF